MKIILVANTLASIVNHRLSLINALHARDLGEISVLTNFRQDIESSARDELKRQLPVMTNLDFGFPMVIVSLLRVISILREPKAKCLLSFSPICNIVVGLALKFVPQVNVYIPTVNGLGRHSQLPSLLQQILLFLMRASFKQAHTIVFQNQDDYGFFLSQNIICERQKVVFVRGSGVDRSMFDPIEMSFERPNNKLRVLYAGRLMRLKGVEEYIHAVRELSLSPKCRPLEFEIVGSFDSMESFAWRKSVFDQIIDAGIEYNGPSQHIACILGSCDVLILPSRYGEGVPKILLEGLASGCILITTNTPGCIETCRSGFNGFLLDSRKNLIREIGAALEKVAALSSSDLRIMKENSRSLSREFDVTLVNNIYSSLVLESSTKVLKKNEI